MQQRSSEWIRQSVPPRISGGLRRHRRWPDCQRSLTPNRIRCRAELIRTQNHPPTIATMENVAAAAVVVSVSARVGAAAMIRSLAWVVVLTDRQRCCPRLATTTRDSKWRRRRMVDTLSERKRFISQPTVTTAPTCCGALSARGTYATVSYLTN